MSLLKPDALNSSIAVLMLCRHSFVFIYPPCLALLPFHKRERVSIPPLLLTSILLSNSLLPPDCMASAWLRAVPSNQMLLVFPCCRSSLSRGRSIFFKSLLRRRRADAPAAKAGNVKRSERGGGVGVGLLMAAWIHFLILEHFLDLSGICGDSWAHVRSCSQSERRLCFPPL